MKAVQYDYLVVGAGLFGAVFAERATAAGKRVLVVDKRPHVGGNVYTEAVAGIQVHRYGAHIFHTNDEGVWQYVTRYATFNRFTNSPVANFKGELYSLPFNMYTFNKMWGVATPQQAAEKIEQQRRAAGITEPNRMTGMGVCPWRVWKRLKKAAAPNPRTAMAVNRLFKIMYASSMRKLHRHIPSR